MMEPMAIEDLFHLIPFAAEKKPIRPGISVGASARDSVAQVDDLRGESAGFEELEIRASAVVGEERDAAADEDRVDPNAVLIDEVEIGRRGSEPRPSYTDLTVRVLGGKSRDRIGEGLCREFGIADDLAQRG